MLPAASAIADLPTISDGSPVPSTASLSVATITSWAGLHAALADGGGITSTSGKAGSGQQSAVVLSSALPPVAPKLATKIRSGAYVPMKDMPADNMSLCSQLEALPTQQIVSVSTKPRLRKIDNPLTWASCFLAYAAVRASDPQTRDLLTYGCLIIRESQCHSGPGWLQYDKIFRQHAALSPSTVWNELNPSLHASTVLSYRAGPGRVCSLCHEPDHSASTCALLVLHPHESLPPQAQSACPPGSTAGSSAPGPSRRLCQETLERICISWNRGRCTCKFRHICTVCREKGHRAKDCEIDSAYKTSQSVQPGKWRLIVDLSSPRGESINDAISSELCHLQYASVLDAAALVRHLGKGAMLAKIDLHQAYRIIPVHPDDHPLLGVRWQGQTYIDTALGC